MFVLRVCGLLLLISYPLAAATITGPIPSTAKPGDPSHNYPFFSTPHYVEEQDYIEEEFFIEGLAVEYAGAPNVTATIAPGGPYPYKTRVIVRRPKSAGKFNGTVILEWSNVAAGIAIDNDWYWSHEHLMRRGFVHVGVIVEPAGVHAPIIGLKQWNPTRYGSLDLTGGGKFTNIQPGFELSFSIFSQVAQELRNPAGAPLLRGLKVRNIVATGHSRSAGRLSAYYNRVQPLNAVVDGFVFHGAGGVIRTDIQTPAWKLLAEGDILWTQAAMRQPDSRYFRTWEVAGSSHADWDLSKAVAELAERDLPPRPEECEPVYGSRVPSHLVQDAMYDWMKLWIERGTLPPQAPPIATSSIVPRDQSPTAPPTAVAVRDQHGNALGGIRIAQFAVATAMNSGMRPNTPPGTCRNRGLHEAFDADTVARLYPKRAKYLAEVNRITDQNLKAGYITKEGAARTRRDAAQSKVVR